MKKKLLFLTAVFSYGVIQSQSFGDIHKLVEAKKYDEAIPQLRGFIKKDPKHVAANYDLALSYEGLWDKTTNQQNLNVKIQNTNLWDEKNYLENLGLWNFVINYTDSSIYFLKQTSQFMNMGFLTLDLRYNEFYEASKDCDIFSKVKCARNYLAKEIDKCEKANADNKAQLFNVKKDFENFKNVSMRKFEGVYVIPDADNCNTAIRLFAKDGKLMAENGQLCSDSGTSNFVVAGGSNDVDDFSITTLEGKMKDTSGKMAKMMLKKNSQGHYDVYLPDLSANDPMYLFAK